MKIPLLRTSLFFLSHSPRTGYRKLAVMFENATCRVSAPLRMTGTAARQPFPGWTSPGCGRMTRATQGAAGRAFAITTMRRGRNFGVRTTNGREWTPGVGPPPPAVIARRPGLRDRRRRRSHTDSAEQSAPSAPSAVQSAGHQPHMAGFGICAGCTGWTRLSGGVHPSSCESCQSGPPPGLPWPARPPHRGLRDWRGRRPNTIHPKTICAACVLCG